MRRSKRVLSVSVVLVLLVASVALGQRIPTGGTAAGEPENELEDYHCMQCHIGTTDSRLPLREVVGFRILEEPRAAPTETMELPLELYNPWQAELLDMQASLDLTQAPSLGFASGQEPLLGVTYPGILGGTDGGGEGVSPTASRSMAQEVDVPSGVTDLRIRLVPDDQVSPLAPDLIMDVWPSVHNESVSPHESVDDAGAGGVEVYQVRGAAEIAALGLGDWRIAARQLGPAAGDPEQAAAATAPQAFAVIVDAWFNSTGERVQVFEVEGDLMQPTDADVDDNLRIDEPASVQVSWTLSVQSEPAADEQVKVSIYVHQHYEHESSANPDHGYFVANLSLPVALTEDGQVALAASNVGPAPILEDIIGDRTVEAGEVVGYVSAFLLVASVLSGGMFGKASRRAFNSLFGTARRRVAFHNILSYGLTVGAIAHTVLFIIEVRYHWALGLIWGGVAILAMLGLGVTGALQVPLIRRWSYPAWRWTHFGLAVASLVFTLIHILLDGQNFGEVQQLIGWQDPIVPTAN